MTTAILNSSVGTLLSTAPGPSPSGQDARQDWRLAVVDMQFKGLSDTQARCSPRTGKLQLHNVLAARCTVTAVNRDVKSASDTLQFPLYSFSFSLFFVPFSCKMYVDRCEHRLEGAVHTLPRRLYSFFFCLFICKIFLGFFATANSTLRRQNCLSVLQLQNYWHAANLKPPKRLIFGVKPSSRLFCCSKFLSLRKRKAVWTGKRLPCWFGRCQSAASRFSRWKSYRCKMPQTCSLQPGISATRCKSACRFLQIIQKFCRLC